MKFIDVDGKYTGDPVKDPKIRHIMVEYMFG